MALSLHPRHLGRYRDIALLLLRYGRSDLVSEFDVDGLGDPLEQFRKALIAELDHTREMTNLTTLSRIVAPWPRLVVPQPVPDYSTSRVLTMDFLSIRKVTDLTPLARTDHEGAPLVDDLFSAYLQQILGEGFFHANPHPGNVLLTADGRLALLDVGMVARLTTSARDCCVKLLLAVSDGNGEAAAEAFANLGTRNEDFDADRFRSSTSDLVLRSVELGHKLQPGAVVLEMTRIAGQRGLRPAPEMALVGKALLNLDQVAQSLDPSFAPAEAIRRKHHRDPADSDDDLGRRPARSGHGGTGLHRPAARPHQQGHGRRC